MNLLEQLMAQRDDLERLSAKHGRISIFDTQDIDEKITRELLT